MPGKRRHSGEESDDEVKKRDDKRRKASRSKSRSRSPGHREKKHKKREKQKDKSERKAKKLPEEAESPQKEKRGESSRKESKREARDSGPNTTEDDFEGGGEISLSVEDSNKLRAKLGLAPLKTDDGSSEPKEQISDSGGIEKRFTCSKDGKEYVHKPAESLTEKKYTETIRDKLKAMKEKREILDKMSHVKGLGDEDDGADSAAAWVEKSRKLAEERQLAAKRAKLLEDMDAEFGVSDLVESQVKKQRGNEYSSKQLTGLTVEHSKASFVDGKDVILILKDRDVLDEEGEDVLVNPNILDDERHKKNVELRKKKPNYNPYDEETDPLAALESKKLLGKYDEEIDGKKVDKFRIEKGGKINLTVEKHLDEIRQRLQKQSENLEARPMQLATEYLTQEEIVAFKKPKKRVKKLRKREVLRADDLAPLSDIADEDYGSRLRGRGRKREDYEGEEKKDAEDMEVDKMLRPEDLDDMEDNYAPEEDFSHLPIEEDELESELQSALQKTLKLKQKEAAAARSLGAEKVVEIISQIPVKDEVKEEQFFDTPLPSSSFADSGGAIVMDSISEYCRGLGDIPTYGRAGNREEADMDEMEEFEEDQKTSSKAPAKPKHTDSSEKKRTKSTSKVVKWKEAATEEDDNTEPMETRPEGNDIILDEEPDLSKGVAAALKLAGIKGYVESKTPKTVAISDMAKSMESKNFAVCDKQFQDIDDKYAKKLDRMGMGGPIVDFQEKKNYQPEIKLEYADEAGRLMNTKEAFRYLSWKFHGKKPGKKKLEHRYQKRKEEMLMKEMSSTDTPLGTLSLQLEKQKRQQMPYIVLSGSAAKDAGTSIRKD